MEETVEVDEKWMKFNISVASGTVHICQSDTKCACRRSRVNLDRLVMKALGGE